MNGSQSTKFSPTRHVIKHKEYDRQSFPSQMNGNLMQHPPSGNWTSTPQFMTNDVSPMHCLFKCSECQISKSSCEDLEVHIKIEHLNWLPFCCTLCDARRASDNQIREHTYSHHKKLDHNEYRYFDNPKAKSQLQAMTDRALSLAIQQMVARRPPPLMTNTSGRPSNGIPSPGADPQTNAAKRNRLHQILGRNISYDQNSDDHGSVDDNPINGLKAIVDSGDLDASGENALAKLFGQSKHDEIDLDESGVSSSLLSTLKATNNELNESTDMVDAAEVLKNVSSLFSVDFDNFNNVINGDRTNGTSFNQHSGSSNSSTSGIRRQRNFNPVTAQCASKKRVLGQCSKCNKPVTAGARQMHLFFHLSKDRGIFRFKCKFPNCEVEHYRKDQMENHMSKVHGQINHELMEDRSVELYDQIQQLSMELLGTLGNKPGPTAMEAQQEYNRMLQDQELRKRKRGGNDDQDGPISMINNPLEAFQQIFKKNVQGIDTSGKFGDSEKQTVKIGERHEDLLECKLCHKMIINRTRGLHILHHARNDLGLLRYQCTGCDFKHERSQSVATHGKKSHGTEDCVLDTLSQYEDEIKSLWKACFGHEQLFTSESKKKKPKTSEAVDDIKDEKSVEENYQSFQSDAPSGLRIFTPANSNTTPTKKTQTSGGTPNNKTSGSATKKKISSRRFGIRKPQSKKKRAEMAKMREVSMRIGGAMYFKKRSPDSVFCEQCNTYIPNRLTHHAYSHMEDAELYLCPVCKIGNPNRNQVIKHLKDFHDSTANPIDNRSKFAHDIKKKIRECYPTVFVDAPVPTQAEIEQLKKSLNLNDSQLVTDGDDAENESHVSEQDDENEKEDDEGSVHEDSDGEQSADYKKLSGEIQDEEMAEEA